jgi:hypothetical protein
MSVLTAVSRSPRQIFAINDYPGLKSSTLVASTREMKLAESGDPLMQQVICDRYATVIGREGADVQWDTLRSRMAFVAFKPSTPPGVSGMVQKLKASASRMITSR